MVVHDVTHTHTHTHRPDPNADLAEGAGKEIEVPGEEMLYIRDNLTDAENARRQGDTSTVYGSYSNLAQHFQKVCEHRTHTHGRTHGRTHESRMHMHAPTCTYTSVCTPTRSRARERTYINTRLVLKPCAEFSEGP